VPFSTIKNRLFIKINFLSTFWTSIGEKSIIGLSPCCIAECGFCLMIRMTGTYKDNDIPTTGSFSAATAAGAGASKLSVAPPWPNPLIENKRL
jgi:hypothetical protein